LRDAVWGWAGLWRKVGAAAVCRALLTTAHGKDNFSIKIVSNLIYMEKILSIKEIR
jgi:hypothetical protein